VHGDSVAERHCAIVPHLRLTAEQRGHLVALRAAYLVRSAQVWLDMIKPRYRYKQKNQRMCTTG